MNVKSYVAGIVGAFLLFGLVSALGVGSVVFAKGQPNRFFEFIPVWLTFGLPTTVLLAFGIGPAVLLLRRAVGELVSIVVGAGIGAAAGVGLLFVSWLLFRENNETVGSLIGFWMRVPGEFLLGAAPHVVASSFFAAWLVSNAAPSSRRAA